MAFWKLRPKRMGKPYSSRVVEAGKDLHEIPLIFFADILAAPFVQELYLRLQVGDSLFCLQGYISERPSDRWFPAINPMVPFGFHQHDLK